MIHIEDGKMKTEGTMSELLNGFFQLGRFLYEKAEELEYENVVEVIKSSGSYIASKDSIQKAVTVALIAEYVKARDISGNVDEDIEAAARELGYHIEPYVPVVTS